MGRHCHSSFVLVLSAFPTSSDPMHGWRSILIGQNLLVNNLGWDQFQNYRTKYFLEELFIPNSVKRDLEKIDSLKGKCWLKSHACLEQDKVIDSDIIQKNTQQNQATM